MPRANPNVVGQRTAGCAIVRDAGTVRKPAVERIASPPRKRQPPRVGDGGRRSVPRQGERDRESLDGYKCDPTRMGLPRAA
jgi:hypothetical protein